MQDAFIPPNPPSRFAFVHNFLLILSSFALLLLLSLPILLSFDLWIFEDRASFLHLDELLARHYHLGVDLFYSYGLLPVLLQHLLFVAFGRSFRPMIGATLVVMILNALFWAALLEHLPQQRRWLFAVVALSQVILIVNPNWPTSLAALSILYALLFVLKGRLDVALAISSIGCLCVPSLPLVLTLLLASLIVVHYFLDPERSIAHLLAQLAPGAVTYGILAVLLGSIYSFASLLSTAIPLAGARFYKEMGYLGFSAFLTFLHPEGYSSKYYLAYYVGSPVTGFVLSSIFLFGLSIYYSASAFRGKRLTPSSNFVILFSIVQFVFIFFTYGSRGQHTLYEGVLASATLVGISTLHQRRYRNIALTLFVTIGVLGESGAAYKTLVAWRTTERSPQTFGLYADPGFAKELAQIVQLSQSHKTLVLGYATGIQNYYPSLEDPDAWFLQTGQVFPGQERAIVKQIQASDVVVEVLTSPSGLVSHDSCIQDALNEMEPASPMIDFRVFTRK